MCADACQGQPLRPHPMMCSSRSACQNDTQDPGQRLAKVQLCAHNQHPSQHSTQGVSTFTSKCNVLASRMQRFAVQPAFTVYHTGSQAVWHNAWVQVQGGCRSFMSPQPIAPQQHRLHSGITTAAGRLARKLPALSLKVDDTATARSSVSFCQEYTFVISCQVKAAWQVGWLRVTGNSRCAASWLQQYQTVL